MFMKNFLDDMVLNYEEFKKGNIIDIKLRNDYNKQQELDSNN